ncbi:hypothetical protein OG361_02000 [Streptomyces sp. NBC_00090]|uniref:hypothetical protein n=1 Tax=Streptomyces sp. NBC_00090 TaxID=2903619 RepID=UPI003254C291
MRNATDFETLFTSLLTELGDVLPRDAVDLIETQARIVHAERPDLDIPEVVQIARDVLKGNRHEALFTLAQMKAEHAQAVAEVADSQAHLDSLVRIEEAFPELERLEARFPGRATAAQMLADAGRTWGDFGLTEADGGLFQELLDEHIIS